MLVLSFLILVLCTCGLAIGTPIVTRLAPAPCFDRAEDTAFVSVWVGVTVLANVLLAVSLFAPLTPALTLVVTFALVAPALLTQRAGSGIRGLAGNCSAGPTIAVLALTLGTAAYCSQVIVWYDTRLYHMQVIKWLSGYGLVPGLALIHERFGYVSSWFAPAAAVNHGMVQGRIGSFTGGFCLLVLVGHFLTALLRIIRQDGRTRDVFLVAAYLPTLVIIMIYGMPNSPSPDLPVIVLVIETAWSMMIISEYRRDNAGHFDNPLNAAVIPLILGAGAAAIKLSAVPLVVVAGCYYLCAGKQRAGKLVIAGAILIFFLSPFAAAGLVTTGCAFYPSHTFCTELPWSLGADQAAAESKLIRDWARWGGEPAPAGATAWNWIFPWFAKEKICTLFMLLSAGAAAGMLLQRCKGKRAHIDAYVIALAAAGILFMVYAAPTWRFGLGYLVLLPALMVTSSAPWVLQQETKSRARALLANWPAAGIVTAIALATHIYVVPRPTFGLLEQIPAGKPALAGHDHPHFNFLLPPRLWNVEFVADAVTGRKTTAIEPAIVTDQISDITYRRPDPEQSELCGDSPVPCAPVSVSGVRLRNHDKGIAGGFVKAVNPKSDQ